MRSWISGIRLLKSSRMFLSGAGLMLLGIVAGSAQVPPRPVIDPVRELAAIKDASDLDDNPADSEAVQQVCTACHSSSQFLGSPRSSNRWEQLFGEMARLGARCPGQPARPLFPAQSHGGECQHLSG
jgi:hypothetical protein